MLAITPSINIPEAEFEWSFVRASGPGGQNVNKVASKAVLRWNVTATTSLPEAVKLRFVEAHARRITDEGDLIIASQRFRDQERNRHDCLEKLADMVRQATIAPKPRKKTRPSRGSRERRLHEKRLRAGLKSSRRKPTRE